MFAVKIKKIMPSFLVVLFVLNLFSNFGCKKSTKAEIFCALGSEVFLQDEIVKDKPTRLDLCAIKGETESGQIIIVAKSDISFIDISVDSLTDKNGNVIDKSNISFFKSFQ